MNAGRVELDLVAVGKDQVSAMLKTLDANVRKSATELKSLGDQAGVTAPKLAAIEPIGTKVAKSLGGVTQSIIGGFVGAGASGLVGALTDAASAVVSMVAEFLTAEPKIDSFSAQLIATANDAAKMTAQITNIGKSAADASKQVVGFGTRIANLSANIARIRGQGDLAADFERAANVAATGDAIKAVEENMGKAEVSANEARKIVLDLRPKIEKARLDVIAAQEAIKLRESQGLGTDRQREQLGLAVTAHTALTFEVKRTEEAYRQASGAVAKMAEELALLDTLQDEQGQKRVTAEEITQTVKRGGRAANDNAKVPSNLFDAIDNSVEFTSGTPYDKDNPIKPMEIAITRVIPPAEQLRDVLGQIADATQLVAESMPEMGAALAEVQAITQKVTEGKLGLSEALAAGATAIAANAAKAIGGVRAEAAVRAAYEIGMGFATLTNPVVSAGHFTAGALLGAVAAGAGGGGSSRGSGSAQAGYVPNASPSRDGAGTVINNFSALVTDPHQVTRALAQTSRSTQGTGTRAAA